MNEANYDGGERRILKKQILRNNEYYDTQETQDLLFRKSKESYKFKDLISIIINDKNITLAYRNIKSNKGSKTPGVDGTTIKDIHKYEISEWIRYIRKTFENFKPMPVCRVEIEKLGGGLRPLGIPTIEDRMVQQCIKQVLEPIAEAKFYHGSYGFRPDKSAENAIAKVMKLISIISEMLKAEIEGIGTPTKGVPQGGIVSTLLSNIVLKNQW
ncbi:reverse transcriptase domain-containing protein [Clostridium saccharobutylicum]|uniref:Group II intron reverse transcriptase maturase n=1 Tax=Clostridium saccharobutylicum DSM 13864 TaxID=1345695 RepID=U5MNT7_CLOSA|nr:reverse transcriptase domain-containing protein [Clostridium saccharobutylicum]AGX42429.1 group II intron reverse transcriptase maturase [Clostridium saccharobutylicum DSM 13864]AQR89716.1 group II intron-encoded protein LtrA [Clostridium saccharobutylicum]AQR99618.1 group II intron-encoded protein LtrA [Clostridium saccharobutylicum]AQS09348.1 group II intron-encoded protein LtrA [Clostridium saccharobutylicum]AQS13604.1 group II intron-encoded protein LtrA [Clostridium saccharobutylicum]